MSALLTRETTENARLREELEHTKRALKYLQGNTQVVLEVLLESEIEVERYRFQSNPFVLCRALNKSMSSCDDCYKHLKMELCKR